MQSDIPAFTPSPNPQINTTTCTDGINDDGTIFSFCEESREHVENKEDGQEVKTVPEDGHCNACSVEMPSAMSTAVCGSSGCLANGTSYVVPQPMTRLDTNWSSVEGRKEESLILVSIVFCALAVGLGCEEDMCYIRSVRLGA